MRKAKTAFRNVLILVSALWLWLQPSLAQAAAAGCTASISGGSTFSTIQAAVNAAAVGATILVSGTCSENVFIAEGKDRLTLDGQSASASTISGPDATIPTVTIRALAVTLRRFTITGGGQGVLVQEGGTATIDGNTIQSVGTRGIQVNTHSYGFIVNNIVRNNPNDGITISENSSARIGFLNTADTTTSPNTIQNNLGRGISVTGSSTARITGNTISSNSDDGIGVTSVSQADASNNVINGNGGDGILVTENSGVNLGNDTGTNFLDLFNTTTVNNTGFGLHCTINSYADGRLGSLTGNSGQSSITSACVSSVNP